MSDKLPRTFLGFDLPRSVSERVVGLRTLVDDPKSAVKWVKGRNIHLTMRYLGPTPAGILPEITDQVSQVVSPLLPIRVSVEGTGVFTAPSRPRVLWLGLAGETGRLAELEQAIHAAIGPLGFPREERRYTPHITIGRVRYPQKITPDVTNFLAARYEPVDLNLSELHLFESRQENRGVIYVKLAGFPLSPMDQEK
ncbi:MAG: RNA 2',3'-cyclic phosphodiesterase [Candidatus Marinimicrobia bacterium]|nr:RNA 2',3'-cyclic phosphodiesterase [Candidatus Neomarinimicrobiota bacterium]